MLLPLALAPVAPRTYRLTTTSHVRMNEAEEQNTYHTLARQTLLERKPNNTYRLQLDVLDWQAERPSRFTALAADLNQVSNSLVVETDIYGRLARIENKADMLRTWQRLKAELVRKYQPDYPKAFFKAFGQNIKVAGLFEKTLRHKGLHGVLLPGLYGYAYQPGVPVAGRRVLEQFINHIDLPLLTNTTLQPTETASADGWHLRLEGRLNEEAFRDDELRRMLRAMADNPLLKVELTVACTEEYVLDADTGWLRTATQQLAVEVPGIYRNELHHRLETVEDGLAKI